MTSVAGGHRLSSLFMLASLLLALQQCWKCNTAWFIFARYSSYASDRLVEQSI